MFPQGMKNIDAFRSVRNVLEYYNTCFTITDEITHQTLQGSLPKHHNNESLPLHSWSRPQPRCKKLGVRLGHRWCESRGMGGYCGSGGSRIFERGVGAADHVKSWGVSPNFGGSWPPTDPLVVAPLLVITMTLLLISS